jgi:hypothetical protein
MLYKNFTVAKYRISTALMKLKPMNRPSRPPVLAARPIVNN